ncbi:hypothetical protein NPIL_663741 [Nephila pilipes]|uniref:Uncharacterized protein n=1 Tax=Nephila pilipes TaxID=299642 RepID=A0A8X6UQM5_NEPPI|nr:hypothetical protein NPIL_663741 [Nephila pilipes]
MAKRQRCAKSSVGGVQQRHRANRAARDNTVPLPLAPKHVFNLMRSSLYPSGKKPTSAALPLMFTHYSATAAIFVYARCPEQRGCRNTTPCRCCADNNQQRTTLSVRDRRKRHGRLCLFRHASAREAPKRAANARCCCWHAKPQRAAT